MESRLIRKRGSQKREKARASKLAGVGPVGRAEDMELLVGSEMVHLCVNEMEVMETIPPRRSGGKMIHT